MKCPDLYRKPMIMTLHPDRELHEMSRTVYKIHVWQHHPMEQEERFRYQFMKNIHDDI